VVSEINGTWNRITVWSADGTPKYNLQLGPGDPIPARNVRDVDLVDVNEDGLPEIVAALSGGLVLCLTGRCEPLWARRLVSPPSVLSGLGGDGGVLVGCEDGSVLRLDGTGEVVAQRSAEGRPRHAASMPGAVVLGTDAGQVVAIEAREAEEPEQ
jgi:outer membrane protein assembly factor BamB